MPLLSGDPPGVTPLIQSSFPVASSLPTSAAWPPLCGAGIVTPSCAARVESVTRPKTQPPHDSVETWPTASVLVPSKYFSHAGAPALFLRRTMYASVEPTEACGPAPKSMLPVKLPPTKMPVAEEPDADAPTTLPAPELSPKP